MHTHTRIVKKLSNFNRIFRCFVHKYDLFCFFCVFISHQNIVNKQYVAEQPTKVCNTDCWKYLHPLYRFSQSTVNRVKTKRSFECDLVSSKLFQSLPLLSSAMQIRHLFIVYSKSRSESSTSSNLSIRSITSKTENEMLSLRQYNDLEQYQVESLCMQKRRYDNANNIGCDT